MLSPVMTRSFCFLNAISSPSHAPLAHLKIIMSEAKQGVRAIHPPISSDVAASIEALQPEAPVGCCNNTTSSSRRHGRFLVQPLMDANISTTPSSIRAPSPAATSCGKPAPGLRLHSSPNPPGCLTERRPSRMIGRFEVSELYEESKTNSPAAAPVDLINELSVETGSTTPDKFSPL